MKSPIENPKLIYSVFIVFFLMNCWTWHKPYLFPSDKKKNLLFLGLIPIALSGSGNTSNTAETNVTVTGTVTNTNGTALGGHTLTFEPTGTTVTTDVSGNYTVSLPPGTYTVTVTDSTGAVIGTFTITVVTGGTTSVAVNTGSIIVTANGVTGQLDTVATPVFTPAAGTYNADQTITISTATSGAIIYYTLDSSTPTTSSTQYTAAISVAGNGTTITIKAIAVKSGMNNSAESSGTWTINYDTVATPTFSIATGTYNSDQSVSISAMTSEATIYYTTDGSTPTTSSTQYMGAISVAGNGTTITIKAIAVKSGMANSVEVSGTWTISYDTVAASTFSPVAGTYNTDQSVAITTTTSGATLYYTTDGSTPTTSSTQYTSAISVAGNGTNTTIKAIAVKSGMANSVEVSGTWTIGYDTVASPTFSPSAGTYNTDQTVTIVTTTSGATIYYTTDSSTPTTSSTQYTNAISVAGNGTNITVKAIAVKSGMANSVEVSGTWVIDTTIPTVNITAPTIPYVSANTGAINTKDMNWSVNRNGTYSIRAGGVDCNSGTVINSGSAVASVNNTFTVNASSLSVGTDTIRFCVTDSISSFIGSNTITITRDDTAPIVTAIPASQSSATTINVNLSCNDSSSGCDVIAYSSTGTDPAITGTTGTITSGTQYTGQLTPADNTVTTYKYLARDKAGNVSTVQSSTYTIDTSVATVTINSVSPSTTIDGATNPQINWQANEAGTYTVRIGGTNCTDGTLATGTNVTGNNLATTSIATTLNNSSLASGSNTVRVCVQNLVGNYGYNTQGVTKDNVAPVAGNSGTITTASVTSTSLTLNWTKATDIYTAQSNLQYKVMMSTSSNINTVTDAQTTGGGRIVVQDWTANINTKSVSTPVVLTAGYTYWFNVLVKDSVGNIGLYSVKSQTIPVTYTIGGTISGLTANGLVLQNNGGDNLSKSSGSASFTFGTVLSPGATYSVTVLTQPTGLGCTVTNGSGTANSNVANVVITCFTSTPEVYTWGTFTDNFDGTVRLSNYYLTWMKCSQGQTWNSLTNNCDGAAQSFQYCPYNTNACEMGLLGPSAISCEELIFANRTDWRVPTINELRAIIHCNDRTMPYINSSCSSFTSPTVNGLFPNTPASYYWSSSGYGDFAALYAYFANGDVWQTSRTNFFHVRCARTGN